MKLLKRYWVWAGAGALCVAFSLYWGIFAADRFVSESHIVVENLQAQRGPQLDLSSMFGASNGSKELLLLRDYMLSSDMLHKLDEQLKLREHYSESGDLFSRLWFQDPELVLRHYRQRVGVDYDDYGGVLVIRAQAYTPQMAQGIVRAMLQEGERFMNDSAHTLAREQVSFAEREIATAGKRVADARQAVLAYQNEYNLVSPRGQVETVSGVVAKLEGELSMVEARRRALLRYLAPTASELVQVNGQIEALKQQLAVERARLTSSKGGESLNRLTERYERLQLEAEFAQDIYKTALNALERARIEAARTLKKISVLQRPTLPIYPLEPRRIYNIVVYILATLMLTSIAQLLLVIVREHRD
jgi:capsular polysaccharide transport system permease protein